MKRTTKLTSTNSLCDEPATTTELLSALVVELQEDVAALQRRIELRPPKPPTLAAGWAPLKEAAYQTGYSLETIRLWSARGKVSALRFGAKWYVNMKSLRNEISSRRRSIRQRAVFR
jgi:hypothetical protein